MRLNTLSAFEDLSIAINKKNNIQKAFKEYTENLTYDLSVYKGLFDNIDTQSAQEPESTKQTIQDMILETEGSNFRQFFEKQITQLNHLVKDFDKEQHQQHGFYFRKQLWHFIMSCPFAARSALKPRGFAGDSELMRMIYSNDYLGQTTFAKLLHKHAVEHSASQSVRNRISLVGHLLEEFASTAFPSGGRVKVLSVGCGPAIELKHILKTPQDCSKYHFYLLDQDQDALSEATHLIKELEAQLKHEIVVDYINKSIRTMFFSRTFEEKFGIFDFIYSLGLFDYLSQPLAEALVNRLQKLLARPGEMFIGNFHVSNPSKYYMEYWGDWALIHRTEEQMLKLVPSNTLDSASILYEDTGHQMFLRLNKQLSN